MWCDYQSGKLQKSGYNLLQDSKTKSEGFWCDLYQGSNKSDSEPFWCQKNQGCKSVWSILMWNLSGLQKHFDVNWTRVPTKVTLNYFNVKCIRVARVTLKHFDVTCIRITKSDTEVIFIKVEEETFRLNSTAKDGFEVWPCNVNCCKSALIGYAIHYCFCPVEYSSFTK